MFSNTLSIISIISILNVTVDGLSALPRKNVNEYNSTSEH